MTLIHKRGGRRDPHHTSVVGLIAILLLTTAIWPATAQENLDGAADAPPPRSMSYLPYRLGQEPGVRPTGAGWNPVASDDFEGTWPRAGWESFGGQAGGPCWKNVAFHGHQSPSSVWPASGCAGAVSPTAGTYPDQLDSWMVYGPFSLIGATDAQVRFALWQQVVGVIQDGVILGDTLLWGASVDGSAFYGFGAVGGTSFAEPPTAEGWVDVGFDLTDVPSLGNLAGRPQVWVAWVFRSDEALGARGPFIDDIVIERLAPPTVTGSMGGRAFGLNRTPASTILTWTGGSAQSGYQVVRVGMPNGQPTFLPVAGNVSSFTDNGNFPEPVVCYVVAPMQATTPIGLSDTLCLIADTRTGARVPGQFTIRLNQSQTASLAWTPPGGQTAYLLAIVPLNGAPARFVPLAGNLTTTTDATGGTPTCYVLVAVARTTVLGSTDVVCGVPGTASFATGPRGAPGAIATALPQVPGNLPSVPRP